jgi:hypothetical protein
MIDGQNDKLFINNVKRMSKLPGIADSGDVVEVRPILFSEIHPIIDVTGDGVAGNAAEQRRIN